jgi:hypothetical protein
LFSQKYHRPGGNAKIVDQKKVYKVAAKIPTVSLSNVEQMHGAAETGDPSSSRRTRTRIAILVFAF